MVEIICNIDLEKEREEIKKGEMTNKKHNIRCTATFLTTGIALPIIFVFISKKIFPLEITVIGGFFCAMIGLFIMLYSEVYNDEIADKYYNRIALIESLPAIDELLTVKGRTLTYTLKDDCNKIVREFELKGFIDGTSTIVKATTLDLDNFIILEPYSIS